MKLESSNLDHEQRRAKLKKEEGWNRRKTLKKRKNATQNGNIAMDRLNCLERAWSSQSGWKAYFIKKVISNYFFLNILQACFQLLTDRSGTSLLNNSLSLSAFIHYFSWFIIARTANKLQRALRLCSHGCAQNTTNNLDGEILLLCWSRKNLLNWTFFFKIVLEITTVCVCDILLDK